MIDPFLRKKDCELNEAYIKYKATSGDEREKWKKIWHSIVKEMGTRIADLEKKK